MTLKVLENNIVENYLKDNVNKKLSLRKIYRDLKLRRRYTLWLINKSKKITNVHSSDVGSGKHFIHVYTYMD